MAVRTQTFHIAVCNVCGAEFDETGDYRHWDDTPELALAQVLYPTATGRSSPATRSSARSATPPTTWPAAGSHPTCSGRLLTR